MGVFQGKIGMTALHYPPIRNFSLHPHRGKRIFQEFFNIPCDLGHGENMQRTFIKQGCEHRGPPLARDACSVVAYPWQGYNGKTFPPQAVPIVHKKADAMQLDVQGHIVRLPSRESPLQSALSFVYRMRYIVRHETRTVSSPYSGAETGQEEGWP